MNMEKRVTIVTGAAGGIGEGVANAFAKEGSNLVLTDINLDNLERVKKNIEEKYNVEVLTIKVDGGKEEEVQEAIRRTVDCFGKIDNLINVAQASKSGELLINHSKEDFDLAINTGLYATFFFMKEAFPYMKEKGGSIINFGSAAAFSGEAGQSSYAASKEGIRGLSRVAAHEWGEFGIRVNVVCPLALTKRLEQWREEYPDLYKQTINNIPLKHFGDAEKNIGGTCVFLCSEAGEYITGETISVQGGVGLRP
ncbi:MAG: SDR family NAD(P)-dependent oxidoreductase [Clostridium sp.]|uniref:SDR family NAD(P)-dependent oxidoreductase n=1 Tax=Clostridium sp. TaxID=1506 RepID=UPI003EE425B8